MTASRGPSLPARNPVRSPSDKTSQDLPVNRRAGGSCWTKLWLLLPVGWGLWLVHAFGVNVIFNDEWSLVPLFHGIAERSAGWTDLWPQSNEHRMFFPRLVLLASALLTDFNTKVQMYVSQLWVLLAYAVLLKYLGTLPARKEPWRTGAGLLVGFACYNTMQYENFLWGFQMAFLMVLCFAVVGFYALHRALQENRFRWVWVALAAGVVASFSSLQGLLIWPAYVAVLLAAALTSGKSGLKWAAAVGAVGLLVWAAYFAGYQKPDWSPDYLGRGAGYSAGYFLASVGGFAAARYAVLAVAMGGLAFVLAAVLVADLWRSRRLKENAFALGLILFGYAVSGALAIGRADNGAGIAGAMTSRYSTYSLLSYLGMLLIALQEQARWRSAVPARPWRRRACVGVLAVFSAILLGKVVLYVQPSRKWRAERKAEIEVVRNYPAATAEQLRCLKPFDDASIARHHVERLERFRWNVFAEEP